MDKKKVISWALYDWGNSAFATTVMAAFFPMLLKDYWSNPENYNESTFYLGISNSVASLIVAAMAPFLRCNIRHRIHKEKVFVHICIPRSSLYFATLDCRSG